MAFRRLALNLANDPADAAGDMADAFAALETLGRHNESESMLVEAINYDDAQFRRLTGVKK